VGAPLDIMQGEFSYSAPDSVDILTGTADLLLNDDAPQIYYYVKT
jgi:hypothetical protein